MGISATIYVERQDRERWRAVLGADGQPSRFSPLGARSLHSLLVSGWSADLPSSAPAILQRADKGPRLPPLTGHRGLPSDASGPLKKQLRYDFGGPASVESTQFTWFTLKELEAYLESHDSNGEFVWFHEIVEAVSHVLGEPQSLRFVAAFE